MFKLHNVNFQYGSKIVLKNISFSVEPGSFYGIIGPNGSGKTTLLNVMLGYLKASSGQVEFNHKNILAYRIEDLARYVAIVPQNVEIKFPYTCLEVVMMGRMPFKSRLKDLPPRDMDIIYRCLELTDTLQFADCLITEVSGGEKQRVIFAKALAQSPQVLFLDEAFSNMDIYHSVKLLKLLKKLVANEGLTVISIMHDLNFVKAFCHSVIMLKKGGLVDIGEVEVAMKPEKIFSLFKIRVAEAGKNGLAVLPEL
ncbi:ABC transporter ATP-binding protein [Desulfoscipio gibsoniae]|nr:ABC transporter ATP-binding protein [Desulfoscipio gibsoniae]